MIKPHEIELIIDLLELAADRYSNDGCNDHDYPESWTEDDKIQFAKDYHDWNGDPEEFNEKWLIHENWIMMQLLAEKLKTYDKTK